MTTLTVIAGNAIHQTLSGDGFTIAVNGNSNVIGLNGQGNSITLNGVANTLNAAGNGDFVYANGSGDHLSLIGQGNTISANGGNDIVTLTGTGLMLNIGAGGAITLGYGTHAIINGGTEAIAESGGANLVFNGGPAALSLTGSSNINSLNGDAETIAIAVTSTANTVTVNGQNARFTIAGGGNTITANGTGDSLVVTGSNNLLAVNGASGNHVSLANYNNTLNTAGANVTFAASAGGTVNGASNNIAVTGKDNVLLSGSNFSTSISGSLSSVVYDGAYGFLAVNGASNSVTINGNNNSLNEAGSKNTLVVSGLDELISVSGTAELLEVNNAQITVAASTVLTLGGGSLYSNGNIVNVGSAATVIVQGAGDSNNWLNIGAGDSISLSGLGDGVSASGTGNVIAFAGKNDVAFVSGSTLSVGAGALLTLSGASDKISLAGGAAMTVSGAGDSISASSASIVLTGAGNVATTQGTGFAVNGFAFPSDTLGAYNNAAATNSLAALRATGANSVQLVVTSYMASTTASAISTSSGTGLTTESDANLVAEIKQAKADGLSVFLAPHINIDDGTWQALLKPSNISAFFTAYQNFIVHYATIAQANGVTSFSIGDELSALDGSQYASYWTSLIAAVRQVYHGTLTYDSAWNDTANVSFWSQLDEIGANAYVPVTTLANPTLAQLESGWTSVNPQDSSVTGGVSAVQFYENLAKKYGKPVLFTEAGYQSVNGTNTLTGAIPAPGAAFTDYQQQALAEQAMLTVLKQNAGSWFKGLYIWDWNPQPSQVETNDFSPQGKEALSVIDAWYQGTEPLTTGAQTGTLSGNANQVGLSNAVTLSLSGAGNVITLGNNDVIKASGGANSYDVTAAQLSGETITGGGADTLVLTSAGTLAASAFAHISGIATIDLAAGNNSLTLPANLGNIDVVAGAGSNSVNASAAPATTFTAGSGSASFTGGSGANAYLYAKGDGAVTVINEVTSGAAAHGQIEFLGSLTDMNLWFVQSGNNLLIDLLGTTSQLTVKDWFSSNKSAAVSEITAGGLKLDSQLTTLVTAMANYQRVNASFNPQTAGGMPTNTALHNAVVAAWHG